MGATIDELEIKITSNAGGASRSLKTLTTRLTELQKTMDIAKFEQLAQSIERCGNGFKTMRDNSKGLNNIGKNIDGLGEATNKLNKSNPSGFFSAFGKGSRNSAGLIGSLTAAIGKFYATWFLVIRGIKKLGSAIKSSMDYVETFNYFNAAMEQVTSRLGDTWEQAGYDSANEYKEAFVKGVRDVTAEMTGFKIDSSGNYTETSGASLGLNLQDTMKFQAQFAQMSSSMGVTSESAAKLSEVLIKLGGDLASVKNVDFTEAWSNLSSGMVGMSRTVDKYGINIRNANLQTELANLGIDANINKLGQQDKALLRTIVMLNSTKYAWADLSDTINQPANQLRLLQNNFKMLGQSIGNIFLPIVQKVLPYINAMVIALQRFATWLGKLLGFDMSQFTGGGGVDNSWMSELENDAEGTEDALGGAANNAKKLKQQLLGIDELNNLTSKDDKSGTSASGVGVNSAIEEAFNNAAEEYLKVWEKAYKRLEDDTKKLATTIEAVILKPIRKFITDLFRGKFVNAGKDFSDIFVGLFNSASEGLSKVDWESIGNKIGEFLNGIEWIKVFKSVGNFIKTAIDSAVDTWFGSFDKAPLETSLLTLFAALSYTQIGATMAKGVFTAFLTAIAGFEIGKEIGERLRPNDKDFYDGFSWLGEGGLFETFSADIGTSLNAIVDMCTDFKNNPVIATMGTNLVNAIFGPLPIIFMNVYKLIKTYLDLVVSNVKTTMDMINNAIIPSLTKINNKILEIVVGSINLVISGVESLINAIIKSFQKDLDFVNAIAKYLKLDTINLNLKEVNLGRISFKAYATGGFPEDGLFMANHNELIGGFNGKTAVANNEQITEGIARAVRDANAENNALMREQNDILLGILSKTGITDREIYDSVRRTNAVMKRATGIGLA